VKGQNAEHRDRFRHLDSGNCEDPMDKQGSEDKKKRSGEHPCHCLRERRNQDDLTEALGAARCCVSHETHRGARQAEIEHAGAFGQGPRQSQQPES